MGVASGCGEQEVGVASGSGWNLWVWLLGVVLRRYIDFLILLIPTPLVSAKRGSQVMSHVHERLVRILTLLLEERQLRRISGSIYIVQDQNSLCQVSG